MQPFVTVCVRTSLVRARRMRLRRPVRSAWDLSLRGDHEDPAAVVRVGLLVVADARRATAQTFTGGVRGAVQRRQRRHSRRHRHADQRGDAGRRARPSTNDSGEYNFSGRAARHLHDQGRADRLQDLRDARASASATQQFLTLDITLEVGTLQETDHGHRRGAAHRDLQRLDRRHARPRGAGGAAGARPQRLPDRRHRADGDAAGDPQFNRQQDQTNASLVSLGGGGVRANNYLLDGVPITELRGRAVLNPTIEAVEEVKVQVHTYDAEMGRTGGGVFNVTAQVRAPTSSTAPASTRPARCGASTRTSSSRRPASRKKRAGCPTPTTASTAAASAGRSVKNRTFFWAATEGYRSNTTRNEQQIWPSLKQRAGDFSTLDGRRRAGAHLQPVLPRRRRQRQVPGHRHRLARHRRPVHRRHHPAHPPGGQRRPASGCSAPGRPRRSAARLPATRTTSPTPRATGPIVDTADMFTIKGEHKFTDTWSLSGLYIYNKTDEPGSTIMRPEAVVHRQPGQLLRPAAPPAARRWCSTTPTSSTTRRC